MPTGVDVVGGMMDAVTDVPDTIILAVGGASLVGVFSGAGW